LIKKIKNKIFKIKSPKNHFNEFLNKCVKVSKQYEYVAICPQTTGYNYMGVNRATHSIFENQTCVIPQNYSNQVISDSEIKELINSLVQHKVKVIVLSGFPEYFKKIVIEANKKNILVNVIYHGWLGELSAKKNELNTIISLCNQDKINKLGFVKKGLEECISRFYDINCLTIPIGINKIKFDIKKFASFDNKIHIGILGNSDFRKNLQNQIMGALMVENSIIHINDPSLIYLNRIDNRFVIEEKNLSHKEYLELLAKMDVNLYASYSESWGLVVSESISVGVPCMASNNSGVLDFSEKLKSFLILNENDNPFEVFKKINYIIENKENITNLFEEYLFNLNSSCNNKKAEFIYD